VLAALGLFLVVVLAVAVGMHAGGHGVLVGGLLGGLAAGAIAALALTGSGTGIVLGLLGGAAAVSVGAVAVGVSGVRAARATALERPSADLVGAEGVAVTPLVPSGTVRVMGEDWSADSVSGPLPAGARVHVVARRGIRLQVWSEAGTVAGLGEEGAAPAAPADREKGAGWSS
jgi:membrane-bound ClpP family serine protease